MQLTFTVKVRINGRTIQGEAMQPPVSEREWDECLMIRHAWLRQCERERQAALWELEAERLYPADASGRRAA